MAAATGAWRDLALVQGASGLQARDLYHSGSLIIDDHAPSVSSPTPAGFDGLQYIASYADLSAAFGAIEQPVNSTTSPLGTLKGERPTPSARPSISATMAISGRHSARTSTSPRSFSFVGPCYNDGSSAARKVSLKDYPSSRLFKSLLNPIPVLGTWVRLAHRSTHRVKTKRDVVEEHQNAFVEYLVQCKYSSEVADRDYDRRSPSTPKLFKSYHPPMI